MKIKLKYSIFNPNLSTENLIIRYASIEVYNLATQHLANNGSLMRIQFLNKRSCKRAAWLESE